MTPLPPTSQGQDQFTPVVWGPGLQPPRVKAVLAKVSPDGILAPPLDCQACVVEGANVGCDDSTTARQPRVSLSLRSL